ncbi:MAG: C2 family cysteine protease [Pirellulaceae bacterium]
MMCSVDASLALWESIPLALNAPAAAPRVVDDAPNVAGATSPLISLNATGNGSRSGSLETKGDRDAFRLSITVAGTYQFDKVGGSLGDWFLRLFDSSRCELVNADNGAGGLNSRVSRVLTGGTYYLVADCLTGTYALNISRRPVPNAAPTVAVAAKSNASPVTGTTVALNVLGADDGSEANLNYTWSTTLLPVGAIAPTFSANGVNGAKNTTVTFANSGAYRFTVTIADAAGLTTTSVVNVTVNQTLTSVVVTPGTANVRAGTSQQFVALARDQFSRNMATQPGFTWTATVGSINSTGLYVAPSQATTAQVAARTGTKSASASVTVTANQSVLQDAELASLFGTLFVDRSIDRNDMIQLLRAAGSDNGTVDATEIADLKYLLVNAVTYAIPDYVRHLASDIVNGNRANATYLGQALGDLVAGSSATQLNRLVDKWFRGADHPVTSYAYQSFAGSLFVNGPAYEDSDQGYLGDCYFIAAMDAIADSLPAAVQNMFIDNGDNTWTVRFYVNGAADYVSVDRYLPTYYSSAVYAGTGGTFTNSGNELWMALAEKAYAQWNETGNEGRDGRNAYASIEGGWMQTVSQQVLGKAAQTYWWLNDADKQNLIAAVNANKAVTYATNNNPGNGMVGPHAYMVTGYNAATDTFQLYNPWGSTHPGPLTYAQLRTSGQCFVVADPTGSVPASTGGVSGLRRTTLATASVAMPDLLWRDHEMPTTYGEPAERVVPAVNVPRWAAAAETGSGAPAAVSAPRDHAAVARCHSAIADALFASADAVGDLLSAL